MGVRHSFSGRRMMECADMEGSQRHAVAVVGLGIMGGAIALHLSRAGFEVWGIDPDPAARQRVQAAGIQVASGLPEIPLATRAVIASLPSTAALEELVAALSAGRHAGSVLVEASTLALADKEQARAALHAVQIGMLDCPISGTGAQALRRDLSLYASGERQDFLQAEPFLHAFARHVVHVGAFGAGTHLKFAANLLVAIHNVAAAEAMSLVKAAGLDPELAIDVLSQGAGQSRMLELRAPLMASGAYEPATMKLKVWQKDMQLIAAFIRRNGLHTPAFDATKTLYAGAADAWPLSDTAAVFEMLYAPARLPGAVSAPDGQTG